MKSNKINIKPGDLIEYYPSFRHQLEPEKIILFVIKCDNDEYFMHLQNGKLYGKFINPNDTYIVI